MSMHLLSRNVSIPILSKYAAFYYDLATILYGLYETEDRHEQYALFVVGIEVENIQIISSHPFLSSDTSEEYRKEWFDGEAKEFVWQFESHRLPYHTTLLTPQTIGEARLVLLEQKIREIPVVEKMHKMRGEYLAQNESCCVFIFKSRNRNQAPKIIKDVCRDTIVEWKTVFDGQASGELLMSSGNTHTIVERTIRNYRRGECAASMFLTITQVSSLYYERARGKGSIALLLGEPRNGDYVPIEPFQFRYDYAKLLRKMLEITKKDMSLLVKDNEVFGFGHVPNAVFTFCIVGHMEWILYDNENIPLLRYKHGNYYIPLSTEFDSWYISKRTQNLNCTQKVQTKQLIRWAITCLRETNHGALVIIAENAENEINRLCSLNMGIRVERTEFRAESNGYLQYHSNRLDALSSIDGAVFMDKEGCCYGIGVILDGDARSQGIPARGSRFNSTKNYVVRYIEEYNSFICAIVISEDGYVDILTRENCMYSCERA